MKLSYKELLTLIFTSLAILCISSCEKKPVPPELITEDISSISQTSAITGGYISNNGGAAVTARGVCWSTSINPTTLGSKTSDGMGTGSFSSLIEQLTPGTQYYVRAYATNEAGTSYGNQKSFTTGYIILPEITTVDVSSIALTSAISGGNITSNGGDDITARGVCWRTSENPTIADNKTEDGSGTGSFVSDLTNLTPGTSYYVRAYATNSAGTAYGNQVEFSTNPLQLPTLTTAAASQITQTSAMLGGDVTDNGGAEVTQKGICWSTSTNPTAGDNTTNDGSGTGAFTSNLDELTPGTTYYARAYAINSVGTAYGNEVTFDTDPVLPATLTTSAVEESNITCTSAISGGNVSDDGGGDITSKGVCWSTNPSPTIDDDLTDEGPGMGSFTSDITGLQQATTYYVRAYAINSAGEAYGNEVSFTTKQIQLATLSTVDVTGVTSYSALSGGNINDDGGSDITSKGVCWSMNPSPTIDDYHSDEGPGMDSFTSNITGLQHTSTYYVRAYAVNSAGIAYGNEISFTTNQIELAVVSTNTASAITSYTALSGGYIDADSQGVTARGICWCTSPGPTTNDNISIDGDGTGSFTGELKGLIAETTYYVRAYATNSAGTAYGNEVSFTTSATLADIEGNIYSTVIIGSQVWMAENLKTTTYNSGQAIPVITDNTEWINLSTPGCCWYSNDESTYGDTYGALYNWYTIESGDLCPDGWHVPTEDDWSVLYNYIGGLYTGGKLKETSLLHWQSPNEGATNETGFTFLPSGFRLASAPFVNVRTYGHSWSSTEFDTENAMFHYTTYEDILFYKWYADKNCGKPARCIRD